MISSIQDSPETWQRVVWKRIQFSRENPQHALVWPLKTLYNISKCGVFLEELPHETYVRNIYIFYADLSSMALRS